MKHPPGRLDHTSIVSFHITAPIYKSSCVRLNECCCLVFDSQIFGCQIVLASGPHPKMGLELACTHVRNIPFPEYVHSIRRLDLTSTNKFHIRPPSNKHLGSCL